MYKLCLLHSCCVSHTPALSLTLLLCLSHSCCSVAAPTLAQMLLLVQTNVSARVDHEVRMTLMNEAQMGMLEQVKIKCEC